MAAAILGEAQQVDVGVVAVIPLRCCLELMAPPLGVGGKNLWSLYDAAKFVYVVDNCLAYFF